MSRTMNFCLALLLLVPISVVVTIIAVIVGIWERSWPIFVQSRIGRNEKPFKLFKIRTMYASTTNAATHLVSVKSVTKSGRLLRRFKIDELPQIINVLNGTMNFVGPRPGLASQIELTAARKQYGVFDVLPGITGYSQIRGIDMSNPEMLARADQEYIKRRSLLVDLEIMTKTVSGSGNGDRIREVAGCEVFEVNAGEPKS